MSSVFHFCLLAPCLVFSLCTLNVVTDSMLTKAVSASDTGEDHTKALGSHLPPSGYAVGSGLDGLGPERGEGDDRLLCPPSPAPALLTRPESGQGHRKKASPRWH
jgi:hypothetical protein